MNKQVFTYLIALLVGTVCFLLFFHPMVLLPTHVEWIEVLGMDRLANYIGSMAYRQEPWSFPPFHIQSLNYPEGIALINATTVPVNVIGKLLHPLVPADWQLIGIWYWICFVFMAGIGYGFGKHLSKDNLTSVAIAGLFCLIPFFVDRYIMPNLMGMWVVPWTLLIMLKAGKEVRWEWKVVSLCLLAAILHPYLMIMTITLSFCWFLARLIDLSKAFDTNKLLAFCGRALSYILLFYGWLQLFGYFHNPPDRSNLTNISMGSLNFLSILHPVFSEYSQIIPTTTITFQFWDNIQYLGVGWLLLLATGVIILVKVLFMESKMILLWYILPLIAAIGTIFLPSFSMVNSMLVFAILSVFLSTCIWLWRQQNSFALLILPLLAMVFFSFSREISVGLDQLWWYEIDFDSWYHSLHQMLRASGRFFWVPACLITLFSLSMVFQYLPEKISRWLIVSCLIMQLIDLSGLYPFLKDDNQYAEMGMTRNVAKQVPFLRPDKYFEDDNYRLNTDKVTAPRRIKEQLHTIDDLTIQMIHDHGHLIMTDTYDPAVVYEAIKQNKTVNQYRPVQRFGRLTKKKLIRQRLSLFKNGPDTSSLYMLRSIHRFPTEQPWFYHFTGNQALLISAKEKAGDGNLPKFRKKPCNINKLKESIDAGHLIFVAAKNIKQQKDWMNVQKDLFKNKAESTEVNVIGNGLVAVIHQRQLVADSIHPMQASIRGETDSIQWALSYRNEAGSKKVFIDLNDCGFSMNKDGWNWVIIDERDNIYPMYCP